jgi:hypothetical protein
MGQEGRLRKIFITVGVILVANLAFMTLLAVRVPKNKLCDKIERAFARGDLLPEGWSPNDTERGADHFTDCLVLQTTLYREKEVWRDAISSSAVIEGDLDGRRMYICETLQKLCTASPLDNQYKPYYRYWWGSRAVNSFLLAVTNITGLRAIYRIANYLCFTLLLLFAGLYSRRVLATVAPISFYGIAFSGVSVYGTMIAESPSCLWAFLGPALILLFHRRLVRSGWLMYTCALVGCVAAFLDLMAALAMHAMLLFFVIYFAGAEAIGPKMKIAALRRAVAMLAVWVSGAALTITFKQLVDMLVYGMDPVLGVFLGQLKFRLGAWDQSMFGVKPGIMPGFKNIAHSLGMLTYGSRKIGVLMVIGSALGWVLAVVMAAIIQVRDPKRRYGWDFAAVGLATAILATWYAIFPQHTQIHAWLLVRPMYLPFSFGWALCFWFVADSPMRAKPPVLPSLRYQRQSNKPPL